MSKESDLEVVATVQGELTASIIKSHLESEGIPVMLRYESAGKVFGLTVDGLGEVKVMVPRDMAEEARRIIRPDDGGEIVEQGG